MVKLTKNKKGINSEATNETSRIKSVSFFSGKYFHILSFSTLLILLVIFVIYVGKRMNVATVNGQPISRLELYRELEKKEGAAVLDELITKKIIFQEAKKRNVVVSQADIDSELNKIRDSVTSQGSTLEEVLEFQGVTFDELLDNIKIQKILEGILKDTIAVTDEEVKARYEQNRDVYGNEKSFEELKEDIRFQVYQEKITDAYRDWIDKAKSAAKIENNLN